MKAQEDCGEGMDERIPVYRERADTNKLVPLVDCVKTGDIEAVVRRVLAEEGWSKVTVTVYDEIMHPIGPVKWILLPPTYILAEPVRRLVEELRNRSTVGDVGCDCGFCIALAEVKALLGPLPDGTSATETNEKPAG